MIKVLEEAKIDIDFDKFKGTDFKAVRNLVRCGFTSRRKTLVNNLINGLKISRLDAEKALEQCGISPLARAEDLSALDFVVLTEKLKIKGDK